MCKSFINTIVLMHEWFAQGCFQQNFLPYNYAVTYIAMYSHELMA